MILDTALLLAGGGIIAASWRNILSILQHIRSLFIGTAILNYKCEYGAASYLYNKHKFIRPPNKYFTGRWFFSTKTKRKDLIIYESTRYLTGLVLYNKFIPLWVKKSESSQEVDTYKISWLRGTFNINKFIIEVEKYYNASLRQSTYNNRFRIISKYGKGASISRQNSQSNSKDAAQAYNDDDGETFTELEGIRMGTFIPVSTPKEYLVTDLHQSDKLSHKFVLTQDYLNIIEECTKWAQAKDWYFEKGIPWTRGLLFYGKPGTGKTTLAKILGQELGIPIYRFDISSMNNKEFSQYWNEAVADTPCIVLIEDIDSVFDKRKNLLEVSGGGLTFDGLLNVINGVASADGVITIITTNDLSKIDEALASPSNFESRPGRIDRIVEFSLLSLENQKLLIQKILGKNIDDNTINSIVGENLTPAQISEKCIRIALQKFWNNANTNTK